MPVVKHPAFDNVTEVVADPDPWVEQGWKLVAEKADEPAAQEAPKPAPSKK